MMHPSLQMHGQPQVMQMQHLASLPSVAQVPLQGMHSMAHHGMPGVAVVNEDADGKRKRGSLDPASILEDLMKADSTTKQHELAKKIGMSFSWVVKWRARAKKNEPLTDLRRNNKGPGVWKKRLSRTDMDALRTWYKARIADLNSAPDLSRPIGVTVLEVKEFMKATLGKDISYGTARRALLDSGMKSKPGPPGHQGLRVWVLPEDMKEIDIHKQSRVVFARMYQHCDDLFWQKVVFLDHKPISIPSGKDIMGGPDTSQDVQVWANTAKTVPAVNVFAGICWNGKITMVVIREMVNGESYVNILDQQLPSVRKLYPPPTKWLLAQDKEPKRRNKRVNQYLVDNMIDVIELPVKSPDLNPMKPIWKKLKSELRNDPEYRKINDFNSLEQWLKDYWYRLNIDDIRKSLSRMRDKVNSVLSHHGEVVMD